MPRENRAVGYVRRNFDHAAILSVAAKLAFESRPSFDPSELATIAAMRRAHPTVGQSDAELGNWLRQMDEDQILGVVNNTKGVLHEMEFVELENSDGDDVYAALFQSLNNPGFDIELSDRSNGETWAIQLKATDSADYVREWIEKYPDDEILLTNELAGGMGVKASGLSNDELTFRVVDLVDRLVAAESDADLWDYVPGLTALSLSLVLWELLQRCRRREISPSRFRWLAAKATGLKGLKVSALTLLLTIPGLNVATGAALIFSMIFGGAKELKSQGVIG